MKEDNKNERHSAELSEEMTKLLANIIADNLASYSNLLVTESGEYYTKSFSIEELRCSCDFCIENEIPHEIPPKKLHLMQEFREQWDIPFRPNSAYRCELHPLEQKKDKPGEHTRGALDVPLRGGAQRMKFVKLAIDIGATGIGVANTFGHLDFRTTIPMLWKY